MSSIGFFTPVQFKAENKTFSQSLLEIVDGYFSMGQKAVKVISTDTGNVEMIETPPPSYLITALKILSYFTIVIPAAMLIIKTILRHQYSFKLILSEGLELDSRVNKHIHPYLSMYKLGNQFFENKQKKLEYDKKLHPINYYIVQPIVNCLTTKVINKFFDHYPIDPISTESFIKYSGKLKNWSLTHAKRKAIKVPILSYFHKCFIVATRYLYVISRDAQQLLNIPNQLRKTTDVVFNQAQEKVTAHLDCMHESNEPSPTLKSWLVSELKRHATDVGKNVATRSLELLKKETAKVISTAEDNLRKVAVNIAAKELSRQVLSTSIQYGLPILFAWYGPSFASVGIKETFPVLAETIPYVTSRVFTVTGLGLCYYYFKPITDQLYEAHQDDFQEQESIFSAISKIAYLNLASKIKGLFGESQSTLNFESNCSCNSSFSCLDNDGNEA